ncbi:MAG TPA: M56 family metallopeptidase [Acidobacteriaceae bacterium]
MIHSTLIESALRSLFMAVLVWAGMYLLRVRHVLAQKIAWTLVLCASCVMALPVRLLPFGGFGDAREWLLPVYRVLPPIDPFPAVPPAVLLHRHPQVPRVGTARRNASPMTGSSVSSTLDVSRNAGERPLVSPSPLPATASLSPGFLSLSTAAWLTLGGVVYFTICAALLFRFLFGLALAVRIWRRAFPIAPLALSPLTESASVRVSHDVATPVTIGSSILLPASYTTWSATKLRVVLAHERSHIRQGDFYLQLVARFYTALFWFSPLGWWLQQKLSDLGEAVSDRAALSEASDRPSYAEMLLEFAAGPQLSLVGVGIVRSSNLHKRLDLLLNETHFRLAFLRGRRHAWVAASLVVLAFTAARARVRVQAAETPAMDLPSSPIAAPTTLAEAPPKAAGTASRGTHENQAKDAYAIVNGESGTTIIHGPLSNDFEKVRRNHSGSYLWFRRDGKSYIIEDPALVEESQEALQRQAELGFSEKRLADAARILSEHQVNLAKLQTQIVIPKIDMPAIQAEVDASLKSLNLDGRPLFTERELSELKARLAEANKKIAEMQSKLGAQHATLDGQVSNLSKKQAELAQTQARLAAEQAAKAEMASRRMKSLLDQALRDGKAKPVQ